MKKQFPLINLFLMFASGAFAQLPNEYITKVTYLEQRLVSFEMIGENEEVLVQSVESGENYPVSPYGVDCLNLGELSRYHGYSQNFDITQYIDLEGDLLTDKRITYEENVRDDWMESYSRLILGKQNYEIYGENDQLLYSFPRENFLDSLGPIFMSGEDAANFEHYVLDDSFYLKSVLEFENMAIPPILKNENGVLTAEFDSISILYDHHLKLYVLTEYDWYRVNKKKESAMLYGLTDDSSGYAPLQELIIEWFKTANGCCVRKTTEIIREQYHREVNADYVQYITPFQLTPIYYGKKANKDEEYTISLLPGTLSFMVQSANDNGETLHIAIYDLAGKLLSKQQAKAGTPIKLPSVRAGLYLIEIHNSEGKNHTIRKVIKPESGNTF